MARLLLLIIITVLFTPMSAFNNLVTTHSGRINGKIVRQNGKPVKAYLGIPYAEPPLKHLRFKKPKPIDAWDQILQARSLPPGCVQFSRWQREFVDDLPGLSEDCLYLNIWTPVNSEGLKKLEVMFWIHGGGFGVGSTRLDKYNGQVLAGEGNVIVVSTNYRLGAAGFFFSDTEDAPGNMGMWDIVEALKWVRNNIQFFGGDKDSITLFGESAGGIAIGLFCLSPITKGLFKNAILQSGSPMIMEDGEDNDKCFRVSQKLSEAVGCAPRKDSLKQRPQAVVECMRNKDPFELAEVLADITLEPRVYYPRFGDTLLPKKARRITLEGNFTPVNLLVGATSGEGAHRITGVLKNISGTFGEKNPQINLTFGEAMIRDQFKNYCDQGALVKHYLHGLQENDYDEIRKRILASVGDYFVLCPSVYFAESFAKKGASVYYFFFTHIPSNAPYAPWMLSVHASEIEFVFGVPLRYPQNYTREEQELSRRMMRAWSRFAKKGKPAPGAWPLYSRQSSVYQDLNADNACSTGVGPHRKNCDFWRPHFGF